MTAIICTLDYVEKALEAEKRLKKGERQKYCQVCSLWRWEEECSHTDKLSQTQFDIAQQEFEKGIRKKKPK